MPIRKSQRIGGEGEFVNVADLEAVALLSIDRVPEMI
jgi:hypothetical protein